MELSAGEQAVMERFAHKSHSAGGPKPGYVLRRGAVLQGVGEELEAGITALVERGLLTVSEGGEFVYLTEAGVETLAASAA